MEQFYSILLVALEMTFVFVALGLLHSQRRALGSASFYMTLGLLFLFAQLVCAADLRSTLFGGMDFQLGSTVLFLPYLAALLLVYITDGTLSAQRLIIGSLVLFGFYIYLAEITRLQTSWIGFSISSFSVSAVAFDDLLAASRRSMVAMVAAHLLDLFMLPIIFTRLKNAGGRMFFCVLGALSFTQIADSLLYVGVLYYDQPDPLKLISGSFLARLIATLWLSVLLTVYLRKIEQETEPRSRSALDIFFAFFGSYGRSKALEESLREWEGRYQQILQNASEMIVLLNPEGRILDANFAAARIMGRSSPQELLGIRLFQWMRHPDGTPLGLELPPPETLDAQHPPPHFPLHFTALVGGDAQQENWRTLSCSLAVQLMKQRPVLVLIGRDVTEENRLEQERNQLHDQLIHAQRIESLGQLAGGVAHDFNNHIHAILGHVDVINFMHAPDNPEVNRHLNKIAEIAEQAGKLTGQLLGFARKGKYQIVDVELRELVEKSLELLAPKSQADLDIEYDPPSYPLVVRGDQIQLQQVVLNLLINAIDAMSQNGRRKLLQIEVGEGDASGTKINRPADLKDLPMSRFYYLKIKDNGPGMDGNVKSKIFEPFFTTKPVGQGTGMGLAMVYGTVTSHHGWVQLTSSPGKGAAFYVFLPKAEDA